MALIELIQLTVTENFLGTCEMTMLFYQDIEHRVMHGTREGQYQGDCNCCMQVIAFSSEASMWCCSDPKLLTQLFH